jgi:hypothetical protein
VKHIPIRIGSGVVIVMGYFLLSSFGKKECVVIVDFGIMTIGIITHFAKCLMAGKILLHVNNSRNLYDPMKPIQNGFPYDKGIVV